MRARKLSPRVAAMAAFVGAGESIADIGADHGYLPLHLVREGVSPFAILTDVKPGPLEKARASVARAASGGVVGPPASGVGVGPPAAGVGTWPIDGPGRSFSGRVDSVGPIDGSGRSFSGRVDSARPRIELRLGDGLAALGAGEADVVAIAGMGGETIIAILEADPEKTRSFRKFILQPRTRADLLKGWLAGNGWAVLAETKVEEKGRLCDIIICSPIPVAL